VASKSDAWLVILENHYPNWLVSKKVNVKPCMQDSIYMHLQIHAYSITCELRLDRL